MASPSRSEKTTHLVVIGERNDARADAEDHGRVDLAVRPGMRVHAHCAFNRRRGIESVGLDLARLLVDPRSLEVLGSHADHDRLLLLRVEVLDHAVLDEVAPLHLDDPGLLVRLDLKRRDVVLGQNEALVLDDEEGTADATGVGEEAELLLANVANDRDLVADVAASS